MYTSESELFSKEFRKQIFRAIQAERSFLLPEDFLSECGGNSSEAEEVMNFGFRWKSDEECYQSVVMSISDNLRGFRGPGSISAEEAQALERDVLRDGDGLEFLAKSGILGAISCDHWYLFEKHYE